MDTGGRDKWGLQARHLSFPGWACPLNPPPHHPVRGWTHAHSGWERVSLGCAPRSAASLSGEAGGGGEAPGWGREGCRPPLRLAAPPPPPRAARPPPCAQPAPARSLGAASSRREDAQGRDRLPAPQPTPRTGIKPGRRRAGTRGPASFGARGGGARTQPLPAPPPLGPGSRSGAPRARTRDGRGAEAVPLAEQ